MSDDKLPSVGQLKDEAKRLRARLADTGQPISHSQSLERIAQHRGLRDWNTLYAAASDRSANCLFNRGQTVTGTYLGQPIEGTIHNLTVLSDGRFRLTIDLNKAVDVVRFDSFSSFRRRLKANVTNKGITIERTSDGQPQLALNI